MQKLLHALLGHRIFTLLKKQAENRNKEDWKNK
jgi:hypothetical protein